jgi:4-hydroxy-tetrahydrodipicolinate synthase
LPVARLWRVVDNFVGVKETTKDFEHFSRVLRLCGPELIVWSGIELLCLPLLALGGAGFLSATANIAPAAHARMFELWESGDQQGARDIHYGLHPLVDLLFVETNPAPGKWVLEQRGLIRSGYVRPPLITPTDAGLAKIREYLSEGEQYLTPVASEFLIGSRS